MKTYEGLRATAPQQTSTHERRSVRTHVMWFTMLRDLSDTASKRVYRAAKKKIEELLGTVHTSEFGSHGCQYGEWFLNKSHLLYKLVGYPGLENMDSSWDYRFSAAIVASLQLIEDTISSMLGWQSDRESC